MTRESAVYFNRAKEVLRLAEVDETVTMQIFQRKENTVACGIREVLFTLLHARAKNLEIRALDDGEIVQPWEPVMEIKGALVDMVQYESVYLGILARSSRVASNTHRVVKAANGKPVYFFGDRFDHPSNQPTDGYAAMIGGASAVCTEAMTDNFHLAGMEIPAVGTMPHALIAAFGGDVVKAAGAFQAKFPDVPLHALVDFNNSCVEDSMRCLRAFGDKLAGVRLDTSANMMDRSITMTGDDTPTGVNAQLVRNVREALDYFGGSHVKITVSGGFNAEKIAAFEKAGVPVDIYAVGSSIVTKNPIDYTADVVYPVAKAGRRLRDSSRLRPVSLNGV